MQIGDAAPQYWGADSRFHPQKRVSTVFKTITSVWQNKTVQ